MKTNYKIQILWDDLQYVAILAPLSEKLVQCALLHNGRYVAHVFLLNNGLLPLTDIYLTSGEEATDDLLLAVRRVRLAHSRACREGRSLL
jgi:hypothetical protein